VAADGVRPDRQREQRGDERDDDAGLLEAKVG
jgi:hypothetical protein